MITLTGVTAVRLQYFDPRAGQRGSDKFYDTYVYPGYGSRAGQGILVKHWGRVGTVGQHVVEQHESLQVALAEAEDIKLKKLKKGYRTTATESFDYTGYDTLSGVVTYCSDRLDKSSTNTALNEYRNQEKYGVTSLIEEDLFA